MQTILSCYPVPSYNMEELESAIIDSNELPPHRKDAALELLIEYQSILFPDLLTLHEENIWSLEMEPNIYDCHHHNILINSSGHGET